MSAVPPQHNFYIPPESDDGSVGHRLFSAQDRLFSIIREIVKTSFQVRCVGGSVFQNPWWTENFSPRLLLAEKTVAIAVTVHDVLSLLCQSGYAAYCGEDKVVVWDKLFGAIREVGLLNWVYSLGLPHYFIAMSLVVARAYSLFELQQYRPFNQEWDSVSCDPGRLVLEERDYINEEMWASLNGQNEAEEIPDLEQIQRHFRGAYLAMAQLRFFRDKISSCDGIAQDELRKSWMQHMRYLGLEGTREQAELIQERLCALPEGGPLPQTDYKKQYQLYNIIVANLMVVQLKEITILALATLGLMAYFASIALTGSLATRLFTLACYSNVGIIFAIPAFAFLSKQLWGSLHV